MMKECSKCRERLPASAFNKDRHKSDGLRSYCRECQRSYSQQPETKAQAREYVLRNWEKIKAQQRERMQKFYRPNNRERMNERAREYRKSHGDAIRKSESAYTKRNAGTKNCKSARRRSAKLDRTPPWLTEADYIEIDRLYQAASKLTEETGIKHHVDRIIPLRGKTVSGLHVPSNLQIITATENLKKGNNYVP